ncbi:CPA2 family monovalent cation:H+ antiporter-2 [Chromobacterium alkanivorans]|uniref:YbaL family putative K(+) efflux transporter n=1 Tax=Chromobacterium alkanivorans TaxID=1071719 RepID=UPI00216A9411|nr:YbaL family putative K(+) efflux transporter [Chromobacterium alkanivorans]MCS3820998.1 CPA2 family monovalent cation:H+ antiporter-2 [Chromobacterium alkanivorans]MCS3875920.1 CPA2 family monovalent cation:H+ antiporter-2 [Chromobacterium alkanivorans]
MVHDVSLITTIAAGLGLSLILGLLCERMRIPALVGYLLAGIVIGPATPGFVADMKIAAQLSEIGVMLLMFGVGLHFSMKDLLSVKRIAVPGAIVQMSAATGLALFIAWCWGWSWSSGLIFGLSLSCASTVVLLKALEVRGILDTINGRIAVGWLVVEDLACVLVLVLMPPLAALLSGAPAAANAAPLWQTIMLTLLQVAAFIALMLIAGRRLLPWLLWRVAKTGSRELFTLAVTAAAIGIAFGAAHLFNVSFALGAFFAGMMMRESEFSHRAARESLPLRDAFSVLFFVSVGMLFDPAILLEQPLMVLSAVAVIMLGKTLAALILVILYRYPLTTALTIAASLAQIGEFSFILAGLGVTLGLLSAQGMSLVLASALISIALNPLLFALLEPLRGWLLARSEWARSLERRPDPYAELPMSTERKYLEGQVVLVGYGRIGRGVAAELERNRVPFVVVDHNRELVETLRNQGRAAVTGDAAEPGVLIQAHIVNASVLAVTTSDALNLRQMVEVARTLNPELRIALRARNAEEAELLRGEGLGAVFLADEELAGSIGRHVLHCFTAEAAQAAP